MSAPKEMEQGEQMVNKQVTVVGYTGETERDVREWLADEVDDKYGLRETTEIETHIVNIGDVPVEVSEEKWRDVQKQFLDEVSTTIDVEEEEDWKFATAKAAHNFRDDVWRNNDDVDFGDIGEITSAYKATRDGRVLSDSIVRVSASVKMTEMLVHPTEMEPGNVVVEDEPEQVAFKLKVKYKDVTEEEAEFLDENVLQPIINAMGHHDLVERVRWTDCEKQTVEKMVCYNI
jgi:hypothetical protein